MYSLLVCLLRWYISLCRVEKQTGMLFRFAIGHSENRAQEAAMNKEIEEKGAFLRLPIQVGLQPPVTRHPWDLRTDDFADLKVNAMVNLKDSESNCHNHLYIGGIVPLLDISWLYRSRIALHQELLRNICQSWQVVIAASKFVQEAYASLTTKTLVFLQVVIAQYDADYIVKVDDDVYLRTDRLPYAMAQWTQHRAGLLQ